MSEQDTMPANFEAARTLLKFQDNNFYSPENLRMLCEGLTKEEIIGGYNTLLGVISTVSPAVYELFYGREGTQVLLHLLDHLEANQ